MILVEGFSWNCLGGVYLAVDSVSHYKSARFLETQLRKLKAFLLLLKVLNQIKISNKLLLEILTCLSPNTFIFLFLGLQTFESHFSVSEWAKFLIRKIWSYLRIGFKILNLTMFIFR